MGKAKEETKAVAIEPQLIRKITGKTVMTGVDIPIDKAQPLYTVLGVIKSYDTGDGEYGSWIKFKGDFVATRISDGAVFRAPACMLQKPLDDVLANQFDKAIQDAGEEAKGVSIEMAVEIGVEPADTPTKYQWTMVSLIPLAANNALDALAERVQARRLESK